MPKHPEVPKNESTLPPGHWVWSDEAATMEFVSSRAADEGDLSQRKQTNVNFNELQQRSEWLAEMCTVNRRGRQSIRKRLSPAHLSAYRSSVMRRSGDRITTEDVKRKCRYVMELMTRILQHLKVAVGLLQENYSLPIPFCFLAVLKSKELDEVLTALLLYLSCFFEHKYLENKPKQLVAVDTTEQQMMAKALAKKEIAQKKLAVCYFSLIMDLEIERHQRASYHKGQMSPNSTEWLLHACLYSFFCFAAWVTFGRKDLRDIQEEVGRLLYSDTFNDAVRNRTDGNSGMTFATVNGSVETGEADPKETGCSGTLKRRTSQKRPSLSSIVNQRSPLMVCLLPSPKERSPHLFLCSRARRKSPPQPERRDTEALTEELNQQLADVSFGILGKPLSLFSRSTLMPCGEQEHDHHEPGSDVNNNSKDRPAARGGGSRSTFMQHKSTDLSRYGNTTHINARKSAATVEAVTSDAE